MLNRLLLVLVEAALEIVPPECRKHPSVVKDARRRGKNPGSILLDRSYHHAAMKDIKNSHKRGRPDIIHFSLLEALGSPLNKKGMLETYVSTVDGYVIYVKPQVRLPKNYDRFKGLIEQLYEKQIITSPSGEELLRLERKTLKQLLEELTPSAVYLMSEEGQEISLREMASEMINNHKPAVMIGAFPHGVFNEETVKLASKAVKVFEESLEAWTVVSRVLCSVEALIL